MAVYNGPPRGGSRGGRDQFNWEDVKGDKEREYYLGHSVKALAGRWQKGKDVYWYTREKGNSAVGREEMLSVKAQEEQLMAEALGYKPQASHSRGNQLEKHEMSKLLERSKSDDADAMASKGLGFAPRAMGGMAAREQLPGFEEHREPRREREPAAATQEDEPEAKKKRHRSDRSDDERPHKHSKRSKEHKHKEHKHKKSKEHKQKKSKEHKHRR